MADRNIWIIGAGGFAFDIACKFAKVPGHGNQLMGFIDSRENVKVDTQRQCENIGLPVIFEAPENFDFHDTKNRYMFGIGDPQYKKSFAEKYSIGPNLFHRFEDNPSINEYTQTGLSLYWGCRLASNVEVGYASFIDANTVIGHGAVVGNFCHLAVGVIVGGNAHIGDATYIHSGAIIGNNVNVGANSIIGVGAVVIRDLAPGSKIIAPKSPLI